MSMSMLEKRLSASPSPGKSSSTLVFSVHHHDHRCVYCMAACGIGLPIAFLSNPSPTSSSVSALFEATVSARSLGSQASTNRLLVTSAMRYIGTAEERAAKNHADDDEQITWDLDILKLWLYENCTPAL
jgi:hypothetical protein